MMQYSIKKIDQQKWAYLFVKTFREAAKSQSQKKKATFIGFSPNVSKNQMNFENAQSQILKKMVH